MRRFLRAPAVRRAALPLLKFLAPATTFVAAVVWASPCRAQVVSEIHYAPPEGSELEFVELYNPSEEGVSLDGWVFRRGIRYEFPAGSFIPAGERLVICRSPVALAERFGLPPDVLHGWILSSLDNAGETVELVNASGEVVEEVRYDNGAPWPLEAAGGGPSLERLCAAHSANDPANWSAEPGAEPTPLAESPRRSCPPPPIPPPLVALNEIYYHPLDDREELEFVEILNTSDEPFALGGACFSDGIDFCFESGVVMPPDGLLVVCRDVEAASAEFGIENAVGNFQGRLSNSGERLTLVDASGRLLDSVRYTDQDDWPVAADGLGSSLERIVPAATSDDPANWRDSSDAAVTGWRTGSAGGIGTSSRFYIYASGEAEFLIDNLWLVETADPDTNLLPGGGFDTGIDGWSATGTHADSGWSPDRGPDGSGALHLVANGRGGGSRHSVNTETITDLDRSGDTTYRLSFDYLHLAGSRRLTLRLSGSSGRRGVFFLLGSGPSVTPGEANNARSEIVPPFVTRIRREPRAPTSSDPTTISAEVRGEGIRRVTLTFKREFVSEEPEDTALEMRDDGLSGDGTAGDGIWGATIPPHPHSSVVGFRIEAESPAAVRASPPDTDSVGYHGYYVNDNRPESKLPRFTLVLPPQLGGNTRAAIARLNCSTYVDAALAHRGDLYPCGLRRRGQSVCGDPDVIKKFLKVRFARGREFEGLRKLNFQSLWTDKSLVREHLAWKLFEEVGNPACFDEFVRLHANGEYFGLYAILEHPDARFLERNGLNPDGNLYKAVASREERTGSRDSVQASYEKKTNEDGDFSDLSLFLNEMHSTRRTELVGFFSQTVDEDAVIDYQAAQVLTNNRDYPHKNHYLYHDTARGKWLPITWDMDLTFGKRWDGNNEGVLNDLMDNPGITPWYTTTVRGGGTGNHFLDKFFSQGGPWYRRAYLVRLWDLLREKYTPEIYDEKIETLRELLFEEQEEDIRAWGRSRPSPNDRQAPAEFEPNLERVRRHIQIRHRFLTNYVERTERSGDHDRLKITELMYNPIGSELGEFLELWNHTGREIDISGWTIEGLEVRDLDGETIEFRFPEGTVVAEDEVFVLAKDPQAFRLSYGHLAPEGLRVVGPYLGNLANDGETLRVKDTGLGQSYPATVDFLRYDTRSPWPVRPDGFGHTLELTEAHPDRDNDLARHWRSSLTPGGSPGIIRDGGAEPATFRRGNCNGDGSINVTDAVSILRYLFGRGAEPPCLDACDADADERLAISDAIALLQHLFIPDRSVLPPDLGEECEPSTNGFCRTATCEG